VRSGRRRYAPVGDVRHVVDQVSGFLCRDDSEYVDRVVSLFANPGMAQSMGVAGQRFVKRPFSLMRLFVRSGLHLFNEVLSSTVPNYSISSLTVHILCVSCGLRTVVYIRRGLHALVSFVDRVRGVFLKRY